MAHKANLKRKLAGLSGDSAVSEKKSRRPKNDDGDDSSNSLLEDSGHNNVKGQTASIGRKLMSKMGYREGKGLGKHEQGVVTPISASSQKGRRGFGYSLDDIQLDADLAWDPLRESEYVSVQEEVSWLTNSDVEVLDFEVLKSWEVRGPKKLTIDDETKFCDPPIVNGVLTCKSVFDRLSGNELRTAVATSNPFETIGKSIFQNRAALKMANMDAVFDCMFTNPLGEDNQPVLGPHDLLYFADICAGPGGFSEYVLWRKKWEAKGFGFTLRGPNDFKLEDFFAGSPETFEPYYGKGGVDGDGNIFKPINLVEFRDFVLKNTETKGVHFVMADGGFSVEGQENIQEILSKRLYLCQFMCALSIIRPGGHFVCKLFDIFTPFSVSLVYLMYKCFKQIAIHKPNTSRPANSERYLICKSKLPGTEAVENYLFTVNCHLDSFEMDGSKDDITLLVPHDILKADRNFFDYIYQSNTEIGRRQIHFLLKVKAFAQDSSLKESRQGELKRECLNYWKVPNKTRTAPPRPEPQAKFRELLSSSNRHSNFDFCAYKPTLLVPPKLKELDYPNGLKCILIASDPSETQTLPPASNQRGFYLGLGGNNVNYWNGLPTSKWKKCSIQVQFPPDTLVYAENLLEYKGEGKAQSYLEAFHIIDAMFLGGKDVRELSLEERIAYAEKLVRAVSKPSQGNSAIVRVKRVYDLHNLDEMLSDIEMKELKSSVMKERLCQVIDKERYIIPSGVLMLNTLKKPWGCKMSESAQKLYYFNYEKKGGSTFQCPSTAVSDFEYTYQNCLFWKWYSNSCIMDMKCQHYEMDAHVTLNILRQHLEKVLQRRGT